jgi:hypothetical protein
MGMKMICMSGRTGADLMLWHKAKRNFMALLQQHGS